ncbi:hypothetical protein [Streptomyces sp. NPDC127040]|uniref:hypothetical protein n=1 Tax=Streptomyces sp. NPDC127040 TaxID=3347116 RepID=UPI00366391CD
MNTNEQMVERVLDRITAGYVFPEKAERADAAIRRRLAAGEYTDLDGPALCRTVTSHLQEVCPDKHLRLLWTDLPQSLEPEDEDEGRSAFLARLRAGNQGVRRVEHRDGNIGLIELGLIADAAGGALVIGAAMQLVAHSTALVLDLRTCLGGSPGGGRYVVQLLLRRRPGAPERHLRPAHRRHATVLDDRAPARPALHGPSGLRAHQLDHLLRG